MDVTDCAFGESVRNVPSEAMVRRSVNVDLVPGRVIEVFAPENSAVRDGGDVQRPGSPGNLVSQSKLFFVLLEGNDGSRHDSNGTSRRQYSQGVETIAK